MERAFVLGIISSIFSDLIILILSVFVVACMPDHLSGGKFLTQSGCVMAGIIFTFIAASGKVYLCVSWRVEAFSLAIPATLYLLLFPMLTKFWTLRLIDCVFVPVVVVTLALAVREAANHRMRR